MREVFLVAVGGAVGATLRYGLTSAASRLFGVAFPWGTFAVNVLGGLLMGLLFGLFPEKRMLHLALGTGVLGGFTTFSAFSLELSRMVERGALAPTVVYAVASVLICLIAVFAGLALGRQFA
jgi:CrcB protein